MSVMQLADLQASMDGSPFIHFLGLEVVGVDEASGAIDCQCSVQPAFERLAASGQWHGGVLASLIDTVGDYAVARAIGRPVPTVNFRTDYLKPASGGGLRLRGIPRRIGRSMAVADVEVRNEQGDLVALGRGTYSTA